MAVAGRADANCTPIADCCGPGCNSPHSSADGRREGHRGVKLAAHCCGLRMHECVWHAASVSPSRTWLHAYGTSATIGSLATCAASSRGGRRSPSGRSPLHGILHCTQLIVHSSRIDRGMQAGRDRQPVQHAHLRAGGRWGHVVPPDAHAIGRIHDLECWPRLTAARLRHARSTSLDAGHHVVLRQRVGSPCAKSGSASCRMIHAWSRAAARLQEQWLELRRPALHRAG